MSEDNFKFMYYREQAEKRNLLKLNMILQEHIQLLRCENIKLKSEKIDLELKLESKESNEQG